MPAMSVGAKPAEVDSGDDGETAAAAAAKPRRCASAQPCRRRASCAPLLTADLEIILTARCRVQLTMAVLAAEGKLQIWGVLQQMRCPQLAQ